MLNTNTQSVNNLFIITTTLFQLYYFSAYYNLLTIQKSVNKSFPNRKSNNPKQLRKHKKDEF